MKYLKEALNESELLNVVNNSGDFETTESGSIVTVTRGAAHKFGIRHQTSNILFIVPPSPGREIEVVLQQRSPTKDVFPGAWTLSCGGHMGTAIDPRKAALREAEEEFGLTIASDRLLALQSSTKGVENFLKVWKHRSAVGKTITVVQMGLQPTIIVSPEGNPPDEIMEFIRQTNPEDLPDSSSLPITLTLDILNCERCFYYLCVLTSNEYEAISFADREAAGMKRVALPQFVNMNKAEMTDSILGLIQQVPNLEDVVRNAWPRVH